MHRKNIIIILIVITWLGIRFTFPNPELFSLYLPNPITLSSYLSTFTISAILLLCIAYYIYKITSKDFGRNTGIISSSIFLFSPLFRISTPALTYSYIILLLFLCSIFYFTKYLDRWDKIDLGVGISLLLTLLLFKFLFVPGLKIQGLWDLKLFEQRLKIAIPLKPNHLFWASLGAILYFLRRKPFLPILFISVFLWTLFIADNSTLSAYLPLTGLLSIFTGTSLNWLLENKFTNRTILGRGISIGITITVFSLFYSNTNHILIKSMGKKFYEAEDLFYYGKIIIDKNASGGLAVSKDKEEAETQSTVISEPSCLLLSGEYELNFRISTEDNEITKPIVKITIVVPQRDLTIARRKIKGIDFKQVNSYQNFAIRFHLRKTKHIEFEVTSCGLTDITVDKIDLRILSRQELLSSPHYIPILMYHKIGDTTPTEWWVKIEKFDEQMRELKNLGYKSVWLRDIYDYKMGGKQLPFHPIVITFDDGYKNFLTHAFPILKKYGFTATVFVITDTIVDSEDKRMDSSRLKETESSDISPFLILPEIKFLIKNGIEFGSHTKTHPDLTELKEDEDLEREIKQSKSILEGKFGIPIEVFSYPYGKYDSHVVEIIKEVGYKATVMVTRGLENTLDMDLLRLKRIYVGPNDKARDVIHNISRKN